MSAASKAIVPTGKASGYLQQLCKHFAHKLPVTFYERAVNISFPIGECALTADDTALTMMLSSPSAAELEQFEGVVVRHLVRFAFREDISVEWVPVTA